MNKIIPYLKSANAIPGWRLELEFENGVKGIINLSSWKDKGGVFKLWKNEGDFSRFTLTPDKKLQWGEEIDMDPDAFYLQLIGKTFEEYARNKQVLRHSH